MEKALKVLTKTRVLMIAAIVTIAIGICQVFELPFWFGVGKTSTAGLVDVTIIGESKNFVWYIWGEILFGGVVYIRVKILVGLLLCAIGAVTLVTLQNRKKTRNPKMRTKDTLYTVSLIGGVAALIAMAAFAAAGIASLYGGAIFSYSLGVLIVSMVIAVVCLLKTLHLEGKL